MNRGTALALVIGSALGIAAGYGEIKAQTDWVDEPVVAEAATWEEIPEEETVEYVEPVRTHHEDVMADHWTLLWDYPNDPEIPDDVEEACNIYGRMFNICPEFLMAVADKETGGTYRTEVKDKTGRCWGCMQVNPYVHKERLEAYGLDKTDLLTADGCILISAAYLADLFAEDPDPAVVLMKYNGADTALKSYYRTGVPNHYTRYILEKSEELEARHGRF